MSVTATPATPSPSSDHWLADAIDVGGRSAPRKDMKMFAEDEPSFWDLVDVINPLQHIPVVNTLYREATGDQIGVGARLAGGTLFGGPLGLLVSAIGVGVEEETGKDIGGHVLALFRDDAPAEGATQFAQAKQEAATAAATQAPAFTPVPPEPAGPTGPKMMIGADGPLVEGAPLAAAAPAAVTAEPVSAPKPIRLAEAGPGARFMPVPGRSGAVSARTPPTPVTVPVSNSGSRSNVPITGRDPVSQGMGVNPATVQRILAEQGHANAVHPLVPPPPAAQTAAPPAAAKAPAGDTVTAAPVPMPTATAAVPAVAASPASQDWFTAAMTRGLDKYEQAARLSRPGEAAPQLQ